MQANTRGQQIPFKIENYTAMANFNAEIDIGEVFCRVQGTQIKSTNTCVQFNILGTNIQVSLYQSGSCIIVGCQALEDIERNLRTVSGILRKIGQPYKLQQFSVYQTMASGFFPRPVFLEKLFKRLQFAHYDPEVFPGLMFRNPQADLPFHITVMANGSFIITGVAGEDQIRKSIDFIVKEVEQCYSEPLVL